MCDRPTANALIYKEFLQINENKTNPIGGKDGQQGASAMVLTEKEILIS